MQTNDTDQELARRVDAFVQDLSDLIRQAALEAVQEALGGDLPAPPRVGRKQARRKRTRRKQATRRAAATPAAGGRRKRIRRSAEDLSRMAEQVLAHVRANPGERLELIGAALEESTKDLRRPVQQLLADGELRTEGQRRGTTYFATGGGSARAARKATRRKKASRKKATRKKATRKKATRKQATRKKARRKQARRKKTARR